MECGAACARRTARPGEQRHLRLQLDLLQGHHRPRLGQVVLLLRASKRHGTLGPTPPPGSVRPKRDTPPYAGAPALARARTSFVSAALPKLGVLSYTDVMRRRPSISLSFFSIDWFS